MTQVVDQTIINPSRTLIIAEAGVNHNGDIRLAEELVAAAANSGADAVKFQTFRARRVVSRYAKKTAYQMASRRDREGQLAMLARLELSEEDHRHLFASATRHKILFLSTPKDIESARLLDRIGVAMYKIGSSEINNFEFLRFVARLKKPILLSTGMSTLDEVKEAVTTIRAEGNPPLILLHCVSAYPCPIEQANVRAMLILREVFQLPVGYSDHTLGMEAALAAVALGATVIEKHFTIDRHMRGPDHQISATPSEFKQMVASIRKIEKGLGDGVKRPAPCEVKHRRLLRRGLVFAHNLAKGTVITSDDLTIKRPGSGLEPRYKPLLIKKRLNRDVFEDQLVTLEMFSG